MGPLWQKLCGKQVTSRCQFLGCTCHYSVGSLQVSFFKSTSALSDDLLITAIIVCVCVCVHACVRVCSSQYQAALVEECVCLCTEGHWLCEALLKLTVLCFYSERLTHRTKSIDGL